MKKISWLSPSGDSFRLISRIARTGALSNTMTLIPVLAEASAPKAGVTDSNKRFFLKLLGGAGLGFFASTLFANKAEALVLGSHPGSSVVGIKDASNNRINPAKEDGNLATLVSRIPAQGQATMAASTPVVIASNQSAIPITGSLSATIDTSSVLTTDPANSLFFLRRIAELLEGMGTVDAQQRLRVTLDSTAAAFSIPTIASITAGTITTVSTVTTATVSNTVLVAGYNQQMFQDVADNAYSNAIRSQLTFTSPI